MFSPLSQEKYHTDVKTLKSLNGLKNNALRAGRTLKVPAAKVTRIAKAKSVKINNKKLARSISRLPKNCTQ